MEKQEQIRVLMPRETAIKQIEEIRLKICGVDLMELCADEEVDKAVEKVPDDLMKYLINAWRCGLVYFDEDRNCLVQKFIKPLVSGEQRLEEICYKNELTLKQIKGGTSYNQIEMLIQILSLVSGQSVHIIGALKGQDVQISMAIVAFFEV